jgi:hypothetical protein
MAFIPSKPITKDTSNFIFNDSESFSVLNKDKKVLSLYPTLKENIQDPKKIVILPEKFVNFINLFDFKNEGEITFAIPKFELQSLDFFFKIEKIIQLISEFSVEKMKELRIFEMSKIFCKPSNIFETDLGKCILNCFRRIFSKMTFSVVSKNDEIFLSICH